MLRYVTLTVSGVSAGDRVLAGPDSELRNYVHDLESLTEELLYSIGCLKNLSTNTLGGWR